MQQFLKPFAHLALFTLATVSIHAVACGEVLTRTGTAMRYHSFVSRHPAEILVYAGTSGQTSSTESSSAFRDNLERAGHHVTLVDDPAALAAAFAARNFDVVIAFSGDVERINALVDKAVREPAVIPVLQRDTPDERAWRERYPRLLTENSNLNQFLKSIEQTMKARGA